jgi:deoxyribonuclease IV
MLLGAHMSIAGGVSKAIDRAESIGCTALQIFTTNARGWAGKAIPDEEAALFREKAATFGVQAILSHDSYLINLAAPDPAIHKKSIQAFGEEVQRCDLLGIEKLVMHPGSALDQPRDKALAKVAASFNKIFAGRKKSKVKVLIEITAGQGSGLGYRFEEVAAIIDKVKQPERFGVCLDTAHAFAAGYDISGKKGWDETFTAFDKLIGLDRLMAFHVNDSKKDLGTRVDRHEQIGKGTIGLEAFRLLMNDSRFTEIPMTLETPKGPDLAEDVENLAILKKLVGKKRVPKGLLT